MQDAERSGDKVAYSRDRHDLAARRIRLGVTQAQLGELAGFDQSRVSRAEKGRGSPDVIEQLHRSLDPLERSREQVECAEADAFWQAVGDAPNRERLIERIEQVARTLMDGSLANTGLAHRLAACLPSDVRQRLGAEE